MDITDPEMEEHEEQRIRDLELKLKIVAARRNDIRREIDINMNLIYDLTKLIEEKASEEDQDEQQESDGQEGADHAGQEDYPEDRDGPQPGPGDHLYGW